MAAAAQMISLSLPSEKSSLDELDTSEAEIFCQLKAAQESFVEIERLGDRGCRVLVILEIFEIGEITLRVDEIEAIGN